MHNTILEFSILNANNIVSFGDQIRGLCSINILSSEHGPHQQEKRNRAIQFVTVGITLRGCTVTPKYNHSEQFWLLTNYLEEIATDSHRCPFCVAGGTARGKTLSMFIHLKRNMAMLPL